MLPKRLTIKGIYSYQEAVEIDFERLLDAQLFGIFGAVGSGKSTILEAISFALFDRTERLNRRGDDLNYNMMNLKSTELLIDFVFEDAQGEDYRFEVKGKRHAKQFDKVETFKRGAYKRVGEKWEPIEATTAEEIIGLSYDNFRRTIIIPQGKFQEFIQLGAKDRTTMLRDIFGLERFELGQKVGTLMKANEANLNVLKGQLEGVATVTEEAIKAEDAIKAEKASALAILTKQVLATTKQVNRLNELNSLFKQLAESESVAKDLLEKKPSIDAIQKQIDDYEFCVSNFKKDLERYEELKAEYTEKKALWEGKTSEQEKLNTQLEAQQKELQSLQAQYDARKETEQIIVELGRVAKVLAAQAKLTAKAEREVKGTAALQDLRQAIKSGEAQLEAQQKSINENQEKLNQKADLIELKGLYEKRADAMSQIDKLKSQADSKASAAKDAQADLQTALKTIEIKATPKLAQRSDLDKVFTDLLADNEKAQKAVQKQITQITSNQKLEDYVQQLKDGDPCPLCGAVHHPDKMESHDLQKELEAEEAKLTALQNKESQIRNVEKEVSLNFIKWQTASDEQANLQAELKEKEASLKTIETSFKGKIYGVNEQDKLTTVLTEMDKVQAQFNQQKEALTELQAKQKKAIADEERYEKALQEVKDEMLILKTEINTNSKEIKKLQLADFVEKEEQSVDNERIAKEKVLQELIATYEKIASDIQLNQQALKGLEGALKEMGKQKEAVLKETTELGQSIQKAVAATPFAEINAVQKIIANSIDVKAEAIKVKEYESAVTSTNARIATLREQTKNDTFDTDLFANVQAQLATLQAQEDAEQKAIGELNQVIKQLKADWKSKKELAKQQATLDKRKDNLSTLAKLFRSSGFVNFISSVYLQDLCSAANERFFKLTKQQLKLEVTEDNSFNVRDYLNNGKTRHVKTLSGGQTFQISLCLALALAESIKQQSQSKQNFFFLDEGFGTLDKESLHIVFDTLKSLRKEQRVVGVISHVEELQNEIDVCLNIVKDEERGSLITVN